MNYRFLSQDLFSALFSRPTIALVLIAMMGSFPVWAENQE